MKELIGELIGELGRAECGSRELDARIEISRRGLLKAFAAGTVVISAGGWLAGPTTSERLIKAPHYTTSLDAALTLVPEGWEWSVELLRTSELIVDAKDDFLALASNRTKEFAVCVPTAPVALCIVALKARQEERGDG